MLLHYDQYFKALGEREGRHSFVPAKAEWKAAFDKEVASLKYIINIFFPAPSISSGHNITGLVKAGGFKEGRIVVLGRGQVLVCDYGGIFDGI